MFAQPQDGPLADHRIVTDQRQSIQAVFQTG